MKSLIAKMEIIAEKYADLVIKRMDYELSKKEVVNLYEIADCMRMVNHLAAAMQKIENLRHGNDAGNQ